MVVQELTRAAGNRLRECGRQPTALSARAADTEPWTGRAQPTIPPNLESQGIAGGWPALCIMREEQLTPRYNRAAFELSDASNSSVISTDSAA